MKNCKNCVCLGIATVQGVCYSLFQCTADGCDELLAFFNGREDAHAVATLPTKKALKMVSSRSTNWIERLTIELAQAWLNHSQGQQIQI